MVALAAVGVIFGAAASFAPTRASAAEFYVHTCTTLFNGAPNSDAGFFPVNNVSVIYSQNKCPNELTIENDPGYGSSVVTSFGDYGGFDSPYSAPITQLELEVSGGDTSGGLEYSIADCFGCAPVATIAPSDGTSFVKQTLAMNGLTHYVIQARCMAVTCPSAPTLRMRKLRFSFHDDSNPQIVVPVVTSIDRPWGDSPIGWLSDGKFQLVAGATDTGSGIAETKIKIDGIEVWHSPYCTLNGDLSATVFAPCPQPGILDRELDVGGLATGEHTLTIDATDAVGNKADQYSEVFYVDNSPPAQPERLRVVDPTGFEGWGHDAQVTVEYDDPWANPLNTTGAPLRYVYYDLQPMDGQQHDPPEQLYAMYSYPVTLQLPSEGRWRLWIWVSDEAANRSNRAYIDLGLDFDQPLPPTLVKRGWMTMDALIAGLDQTWVPTDQPSQLESGICGFAFSIDDVIGSIPDVRLDAATDDAAIEVAPKIGPGRHFAHIRSVACDGRGSDVDTVQFNVDGRAPTVSAFPSSQPGWRAQPTILTIFGADDLSGVARIEYSIDGAATVVVDSSKAFVTMPEGASTVEYRAFDRAGNASSYGSTTVRTDTQAPTVAFAPRSTENPASLTAEVNDSGSGVATAWIEISEAPGGNWRQLGESVAPHATSATFSREISDQLALIGRFAFRIVALDAAGNRRTGTLGAGAEELELPLKPSPAISLGLATVKHRCVTDAGANCRSVARCPAGSSCSIQPMIDRSAATSFRRIRFGDDLALVGVLEGADGSPLGGRSIDIVELPKFGVERTITSLTTDAEGRFGHVLPDGPSTLYTARFNGDATLAAQEQTVEVRVRANVTFRASRNRVHARQEVRFSGRLLGAPQYAADGGKIVTMQFYRAGKWRNFGVSARTDAFGRFSDRISWPVIPKRTTIRFHAKVIPDGNWPFAMGSSESVAVTLVP